MSIQKSKQEIKNITSLKFRYVDLLDYRKEK
jgi:hypothetical protein